MLKRFGLLGVGLLLGCGRSDDNGFLAGPSLGGMHSGSGAMHSGGAGTGGAGTPSAPSATAGEASDLAPGEHRLKPWQLETDGTSPLPLGITDPQNNVHCVFLHDSEGALRCMPEPRAFGESHNGDNTPAHPDCPTPVVTVERPIYEALAGKPISIALPRPTCEPQRYTTHYLKTASDLGNPPECFVADQSNYFFEVTISPALPNDTWQSGTEIDGPALVGGRLRIKQFESADGARFFSRVVDEGLGGGTCSLTPYTLTPCLPPHTQPWYFSDEHCQQPLGRGPTCETPVFAANPLGMRFALGKEYVGSVWNQPHGGCYAWSPVADTPPVRFFELGGALPAGYLADLDWQFSGRGRLQQHGLMGADGAIHFADQAFKERPPYRDTQTNKECYPLPAADGNRYCIPEDMPDIANLPADAGVEGPYVDAACTKLGYTCYADCSTAKMLEGLAGVDQHVAGIYALHELPTAYHREGGSCTPLQNDGVTRYFALDGERPWTDWPALREANNVRP